MISEVDIHGDGIAATCCAKLLRSRNIDVFFEPDRKRTLNRPTLLINSQTEKLISDVFEDPVILSGAHPIRRRVVLWGSEARQAQSFPHSGFAVQESALLDCLWTKIHATGQRPGTPEWSIYSSRPASDRANLHFGTRMATAVNVRLQRPDNDACWIESLAHGWLFLVPVAEGIGSLIAVGDNPARLLVKSRLIGPEVAELTGEGNEFPAHPRISFPLCSPGRLGCGSAAMAFDPICGEGAGNAVREAILAAAVLGTIHNGADQDAALEQYTARLLAGFIRHLELCKQFYVSGRQSDWWDTELEALDHGLEWTRAQLAAAPSPSSRLIGFDLVETSRAT